MVKELSKRVSLAISPAQAFSLTNLMAFLAQGILIVVLQTLNELILVVHVKGKFIFNPTEDVEVL